MSRNMDPTGNTPVPDYNGQVQISESNKRVVVVAFLLFFCLLLGAVSVSNWLGILPGGTPPIYYPIIQLVCWIGIPALLGVPIFTAMFLFPQKLIIDKDGIVYKKVGTSRKLAWKDVKNIEMNETVAWTAQFGPSFRSQSVISVTGYNKAISWYPVFDVSPKKLFELLNHFYAQSDQRFVTYPYDQPVVQSGNSNAALKRLSRIFSIILLVLLVLLRMFFPHWSFWYIR